MLKVSDVSIGQKSTPFVRNVSFSLEQGETLAIMGPSGCGKTTLLKAIAGFIETFATGQVVHRGIVWQDQTKRFLDARQRSVTLLLQELAIWPHLTVKQQLDLISPKRIEAKSESTQLLLEELMLLHRADTLARHLSGGEKQRLALGRALRTAPSILLLDEPFASLDFETKTQIMSLVKSLRKNFNLTLILSTHDHTEAHFLGARTLFLA